MLPQALQLVVVPVKLTVSLIFLFYLLRWPAFVAAGVIVLFMPVSAFVSTKYGAVQGKASPKADLPTSQLMR